MAHYCIRGQNAGARYVVALLDSKPPICSTHSVLTNCALGSARSLSLRSRYATSLLTRGNWRKKDRHLDSCPMVGKSRATFNLAELFR